jgi:hypothetical protein
MIYCVKVIALNDTTFNNIAAISWPSVCLVEETGVSGENQSKYNMYVS